MDNDGLKAGKALVSQARTSYLARVVREKLDEMAIAWERELLCPIPTPLYVTHRNDALRYAMTGQLLATHRKDTTMDRETARKIVNALNGLERWGEDDILDKLEELGVIDKPKKRSILDEEWRLSGDYGVMNQDDECVATAHGLNSLGDFADQIAALPNCLRALVNARDCKVGYMTLVKAALKKAGIE